MLLKTTNQNWDDDFLGCSPPPVGAGAGRGSRERRPPVGEIQHPAPGRGSTSTCRDAGPPPERRAVTAGSPRAPLDGGPSWGRQSTCHRHPGEPMDDIASPPTRHKRALPLSGLSQIMLSAGRAEELAPRASESSVPPFGHRRLRLIATPKAVRWVEHGRGAETQRRRRARQLRSGSEARAATNHSPGIKVSPSISSRKLLSGEVGTSDPPR